MTEPALSSVRLYRMETPERACPWGHRAVELLRAQDIPFEDHPLCSQVEVEVFRRAYGVTTTPQVIAGTERIGGYSELAAQLGVRAERSPVFYTPVISVFLTALLINLALGGGIRGFMGLAICLLAMLKLMDVAAFATSFRKYDLLTQRWQPWGKLYPGVELLVGLGMLQSGVSMGLEMLIGWTALVLGVMSMVSVGKAVFVDHLALNCACVGINSRTPLGVASFAENLIMGLMGLVMPIQAATTQTSGG